MRRVNRDMIETKFEDEIQIKGNKSIVNVLDRIFICLRDFSFDYLDDVLSNKLLNEMSSTIQSKVDKPIPSISNWVGYELNKVKMEYNKKFRKKLNNYEGSNGKK